MNGVMKINGSSQGKGNTGRAVRWICVLMSAVVKISPSALAQSVPGYVATEFAQVPNPGFISFTPDGILYVGNTIDGLATIHRVTPDGVASSFGPPVSDADVVLVDPTGHFTNPKTPGAVLVGGLTVGIATGRIGFIDPDDESYTILFDDLSVRNPGEMKFDSAGRLIYAGQGNTSPIQSNAIMQSSGMTPQVLVDNLFAFALTIDSMDRILTVDLTSGAMLRFFPNGTPDPLPVPVILSPATGSIERGVGGRFPDYLYAIDGGDLLAIDENGNSKVLGSGFSPYLDFAFNPADGLLYLSDPNNGQIVRLDPDCNANGLADYLDITNCNGEPWCSDFNGDGIPDECEGCGMCQLFGDIVNVKGQPAPDCLIDVSDLLCVLDDFSDPGLCLGNGDIVTTGGGCDSDGTIDVDDLLAELDAFAGTYACPHPCPP